MIDGLTLLSSMLCRQSLVNQIGLQLIENLEVTKVCKLWQVQYCLVFGNFIVFVVEDLDNTLSNKEHLLNWTLVTDYHTILLEDTTEHGYDELICEAPFTLIKEMVEGAFEFLEYPGALNKLGLHLGCDLFIEWELFNDEIEIVKECLFNVLTNVTVKGGLDMEWLV